MKLDSCRASQNSTESLRRFLLDPGARLGDVNVACTSITCGDKVCALVGVRIEDLRSDSYL